MVSPPPGDLHNPWIELMSLVSSALQTLFTSEPPWKTLSTCWPVTFVKVIKQGGCLIGVPLIPS